MVYVLLLEDDYYYVGCTNDVERRFKQHQSGVGSSWTKIHKPISIVEIREGSYKEESEVTIEYMEKYGITKVRGGKWVNGSAAKYLPPSLKKDAELYKWETKKARDKARGIKRSGVMVNTLTLIK